MQTRFVDGVHVAGAVALESVKEVSGGLRLDVEAVFSQGLPSIPMAGTRMSVVFGNLMTARPMGIANGVDLQRTGPVRKIGAESIQHSLPNHKAVLLSSLGLSPTGRTFNLSMKNVVANTATTLRADKFVFIIELPRIMDRVGKLQQDLSMETVIERLHDGSLSYDTAYHL